jgi:hypothetical protein
MAALVLVANYGLLIGWYRCNWPPGPGGTVEVSSGLPPPWHTLHYTEVTSICPPTAKPEWDNAALAVVGAPENTTSGSFRLR